MIRRLPIVALAALLTAASDGTSKPARVGFAWPLPTCAVSGEPLGAKPVVLLIDDPKDPAVHGREVRFCCDKCASTFQANRAKYLEAADKAIADRERATYPVASCVIMVDEKLPPAGTAEAKDVHEIVVGNQLVRLCCASCERKVRRNPSAALAKVRQAALESQAGPGAPKACPIDGRPLPAEPVDTMLSGRLVRFCCEGCRDKGEMDVAGTLAKLDAAPPSKRD